MKGQAWRPPLVGLASRQNLSAHCGQGADDSITANGADQGRGPACRIRETPGGAGRRARPRCRTWAGRCPGPQTGGPRAPERRPRRTVEAIWWLPDHQEYQGNEAAADDQSQSRPLLTTNSSTTRASGGAEMPGQRRGRGSPAAQQYSARSGTNSGEAPRVCTRDEGQEQEAEQQQGSVLTDADPALGRIRLRDARSRARTNERAKVASGLEGRVPGVSGVQDTQRHQQYLGGRRPRRWCSGGEEQWPPSVTRPRHSFRRDA